MFIYLRFLTLAVTAATLLSGQVRAQHFEYKEHHLGPTGLFGDHLADRHQDHQGGTRLAGRRQAQGGRCDRRRRRTPVQGQHAPATGRRHRPGGNRKGQGHPHPDPEGWHQGGPATQGAGQLQRHGPLPLPQDQCHHHPSRRGYLQVEGISARMACPSTCSGCSQPANQSISRWSRK